MLINFTLLKITERTLALFGNKDFFLDCLGLNNISKVTSIEPNMWSF